MRGLSSISSFFRNEFNKFNNTRARMLDSTIVPTKSDSHVIFCLQLPSI